MYIYTYIHIFSCLAQRHWVKQMRGPKIIHLSARERAKSVIFLKKEEEERKNLFGRKRQTAMVGFGFLQCHVGIQLEMPFKELPGGWIKAFYSCTPSRKYSFQVGLLKNLAKREIIGVVGREGLGVLVYMMTPCKKYSVSLHVTCSVLSIFKYIYIFILGFCEGKRGTKGWFVITHTHTNQHTVCDSGYLLKSLECKELFKEKVWTRKKVILISPKLDCNSSIWHLGQCSSHSGANREM